MGQKICLCGNQYLAIVISIVILLQVQPILIESVAISHYLLGHWNRWQLIGGVVYCQSAGYETPMDIIEQVFIISVNEVAVEVGPIIRCTSGSQVYSLGRGIGLLQKISHDIVIVQVSQYIARQRS